MIKKAVHIDLIYTEYPYEERFRKAKEDGFDAIEFYIEGWENKDLDRINQLLKENDLVMSAATGATPYSMCDPSERDDYLNYLKKLIAAAKKINCPILMCHSDCLDPALDYAAKIPAEQHSEEAKICAMFDILKTAAPWVEEAGITIVVEPLSQFAHPGYSLHNSRLCTEMIKAVNSPNIKVLYDCYHMYIEEGRLSETITRDFDYIGHIHVADSPGRHDPGTGDINYHNVLKTIDSLGYQGYVAFEFYPIDGSAKAVDAIRKVCEGL